MSILEDAWDKLWDILENDTIEGVVYIYRVNRYGEIVKPFLHKCEIWRGIPNMLRSEYGGGEFKLFIRQGRKMIFSGQISIGQPSYRIDI